MASALKFLMSCREFGEEIAVPITVTEDGELFADYDDEAAKAWRELADEHSDCLVYLGFWEDNPTYFLMKRGPATVGLNIRIAADWLKHAWREWGEIAPPEEVQELLEVVWKTPPGAAGFGGQESCLNVRGRLMEIGRWSNIHVDNMVGATDGSLNIAAIELVRATLNLGRAWLAVASRFATSPDETVMVELDELAWACQEAAGIAATPGEKKQAEEREQLWQIAHYIRAVNSVEQGEPWPTF